MGGKQDDCPRPFVKGSVCPAECWTFPMHRNKIREGLIVTCVSTSINVNRISWNIESW